VKRRRPGRRALAALATGAACATCGGQQAPASDAEEEAARAAAPRGLVELKRQSTARGTPDETTKTNLKFDWFPQGGAVSLLRLELPFPDEKTTFAGSAFDPRPGDAKVRVGFAAVDVAGRPLTSFAEVTFPTADPPSLGTGKYQFSAGAKATFAGAAGAGGPRQTFSIQVQQVVSFAGDPARNDIDQTKFELEWRGAWPAGGYAKATAKPVVDWVGDGRTGAVLELEAGRTVGRQWTVAVMAGGLLWGAGVPGTYDTRLELKLVRRY
jgi:hypothetical protein